MKHPVIFGFIVALAASIPLGKAAFNSEVSDNPANLARWGHYPYYVTVLHQSVTVSEVTTTDNDGNYITIKLRDTLGKFVSYNGKVYKAHFTSTEELRTGEILKLYRDRRGNTSNTNNYNSRSSSRFFAVMVGVLVQFLVWIIVGLIASLKWWKHPDRWWMRVSLRPSRG